MGSCVLLALLALIPSGAYSADIPAGRQEYYILGNETNTHKVFAAVAQAEGKPLQGSSLASMESVITLAATMDGQVIVVDHWEDGFDFNPFTNPSTTTERYKLRLGQPLKLSSTSDTVSGVPTNPRGTIIRYDGGDRIVSLGGPISVVHLMWPYGVAEMADAWEIHPVQALREGHSYTIPIGVDSYINGGGSGGTYGGFKHVYLEVQALYDNTQITVRNGQNTEAILILDRGESYSTLGYVNGVAAPGTARTVYEGTSILATYPVQVGIQTFGAGTYQNRFYNSIPDSIFGTDYVTQSRGTSAAPTQLYIFNPLQSAINITAYDLSATQGVVFSVPAESSVAYSQAAGHFVPVGSGVRLMSNDQFYVLASYDYNARNYDWGYTPVPSYYLGNEISVPWAPGSVKNENNNPIWLASIMDNTKVQIDLNGDNVYDRADINGDGSLDATHDPLGLENYYLVNVLSPLVIYDLTDKDATGMRIVANKPISGAYGEYFDNSNERSGSPDWGYTLLPVIRPWLDEIFSVGVTVDTRSIPSIGGRFDASFALKAVAGPVTGVTLDVVMPNGVSYVTGTGQLEMPDGTLVPLAPVMTTTGVKFNIAAVKTGFVTGERVQVHFTGEVASSFPRGKFNLVGTASGWYKKVNLKPRSEIALFKGALSLEKYATVSSAEPGSIFQYQISVSNIDAIAVNGVVLEDMVPPDVTFVSCDSICDYNPITRTIAWDIGLLLGGEIRAFSFSVRVKNTSNETIISNEAFAYDSAGDIAYSNPSIVTVIAPVLFLDKTVSAANVESGEVITYWITFSNTGDAPADNIVVRDPLPAGITYVPGSMSLIGPTNTTALGDGSNDDAGDAEGVYVSATRSLELSLLTLLPGETYSLRFNATIDAGLSDGTRIINNATLTAGSIRVRRTRAVVIEIGRSDTDCDGLTDAEELNGATDPFDADTDADGLKDGLETGITLATSNSICVGFPVDADPGTVTDPLNADTDLDGLLDSEEDANLNGAKDAGETDPLDDDSDDDGLTDGTEAYSSYTNGSTDPLVADTDGDTIADGSEDANHNGRLDAGESDPTSGDTDSDGLADQTELNSSYTAGAKTDLTNPDTDGDGAMDGAEDANGNGALDSGETDPTIQDMDGDGLLDGTELNSSYTNGATSNPLSADTDADGLGDGAEDANLNGALDAGETDPTTADTDADGFSDPFELSVVWSGGMTDPRNPDTDGDGLADGLEDTNVNGVMELLESDPTVADTDADGLNDYVERILGNYGNGQTDPQAADTDGDGLADGAEDVNANGAVDTGETDPTMFDTDGDGIGDGTDGSPTNPDADGDGLLDGQEDLNGNAVLDAGETDPFNPDTDADGLNDYVEVVLGNYGNGKTDARNADTDADGLMDGAEDVNDNGLVDSGETDPTIADTDGDGVIDGNDGNPTDSDSDDDGLLDGQEDQDGDGVVDPAETDPFNPDTDGDGLNDYLEVVVGNYANGKTDALNPDTDADGLVDGAEDINANGVTEAGETDPTVADTDGDGVIDGNDGNPTDADSDDDGLLDGQEDQDGDGVVDSTETDPFNPDTDGDGLNDYLEVVVGNYANGKTNPLDADTDNDGLSDGAEDVNANGTREPTETDPTVADTDGDGVPDNTDGNPTNSDTDGDGLLDGQEDQDGDGVVDPTETDPNNPDTDGDGLNDYLEVVVGSYANGKTNPLDADTDDDLLTDGAEDSNANGTREPTETDPTLADTDGDGVIDGLDDNPTNPDSDGDGIPDGVEDGNGNGNVDPGETDPNSADTDGDGLNDFIEIYVGNYGNGKTDPLNADTDGDTLFDGFEDANHNGSVDAGETDPTLADSDGDGVPDNVDNNPNDSDSDDDGLTDGEEDVDHDGTVDPGETDPNNADSDNDGLLDGVEVGSAYGNGASDPLNPDSDGDGLLDGAEDINKNGLREAIESDPTVADTDADGLSDGQEVNYTYALGLHTNPVMADTDADGILDGDEDANHDGAINGDETQPVNADSDGDFHTDGMERQSCYTNCNKTNPNNRDTDGDGLFDSSEDRNHNGKLDAGETDPTLVDTDGDGIPDGQEDDQKTYRRNVDTQPVDLDTDDGGVADELERQAGTDIYDPSDDFLAKQGSMRVRGGGGCSSAGGAVDGLAWLGLIAMVLLRRKAVRLALVILLLAAGPAAADKVNPQLFRPSTDGKGMIVNEGAQTLNAGKWSTGLYFNYAQDPLVAETPAGRRLGDVVGRIINADLVGAFGVSRYIEVGAHLPTTMNQYALEGDSKKFGLNDMSIFSKAAILTEEGGPFSLSGMARVKFPTGDASDFLGDGKWGGEVGAIMERHFGEVRTVANLGYRLRNSQVEYLNLDFRDEIIYSAGVGIPENSRVYAVEIFGSTPADDVFGSSATPVELMGSVEQKVAGRFGLQAGLGRGLTNGYGSPAFRAFTGVRYRTDMPVAAAPVQTDKDHDGIFDLSDACPIEPEDLDAFEDENGCPDPDNDKDGLADKGDKCPNIAEDKDGFEDEDGCKDERFWVELNLTVVDKEKKPISFADVQLVEGGEVRYRGKSDEKGRIPAQKVASGTYELRAGAPEYDELQNAMFLTKPKHNFFLTLGGRPTNGFVSATVRDEYGKLVTGTISIRPGNVKLAPDPESGIIQATLKPGKYTLVATAEGFETANQEVEIVAGRQQTAAFRLKAIVKVQPKPAKVALTEKKIEITEQVKFVSGKATIATESYDLLDQIAAIMVKNGHVRRVEIQGHTDNRGKQKVNLKLSKKRANAVRDYLVARGVTGDRLIATGYGPDRPIKANDTEAGRAANRRVEFMILDQQTADVKE